MGLDRDVRKAIVVDGGVRDPLVGSEKLALYNPDGSPINLGDGGGGASGYQTIITGPDSAPWEIQHGLGTEEFILNLDWADNGSDVWDRGMVSPFLLRYEIIDEDTISIGIDEDLAAGARLKITMLPLNTGA